MKFKVLLGVIFVGCFVSGVAFGKTIQLNGIVCSVDKTQITLQVGGDSWTVQRKDTTTVISGQLTVGATVTVECPEPDAHRNEGPCAPTPTPPSG